MLCPKCGMQIKDDDVFCAYCGETISTSAPGNAPVQPPQYTAPAEPVPPYVPPPVYQPPPEGPYSRQPAPGGGKNGGLIAAVIALSVLLAAAIGVTIFLIAKKDSSGDSSTSSGSSAAVTTDDEPASTTAEISITAATETETETETEKETITAVTTSETETTASKVTTTKQAVLSDDAAAQAEALFYSTRDLPTADEFDWCAGQFGLIRERPENAEAITNPLAITGGWKAMLIYEENPDTGYIDREIDNFEIFLEGNRATVSIDWYLYLPAYSESFLIDETDTIITQLHGAVTGMSIDAAGSIENGTITLRIDDFWRSNGKQYAVGTLYIPNGQTAYVALVRK